MLATEVVLSSSSTEVAPGTTFFFLPQEKCFYAVCPGVTIVLRRLPNSNSSRYHAGLLRFKRSDGNYGWTRSER